MVIFKDPAGPTTTHPVMRYYNPNLGGDTAVARNRFGLGYNFHAITKTTAELGSAITVEDRISPAGWRVPVKNQYIQLVRYVYQTATLPSGSTTWITHGFDFITDEYYAGTNVSGFSAIGNHQQNHAGSSGSQMDYAIIDGYQFRGTTGTIHEQHLLENFRFTGNNGSAPLTVTYAINFTTKATHAIGYVRCIRND
jgi:uncharacterized protein (TIGR02145 family)